MQAVFSLHMLSSCVLSSSYRSARHAGCVPSDSTFSQRVELAVLLWYCHTNVSRGVAHNTLLFVLCTTLATLAAPAVATAAAVVPEVYKEGQDPEIAAFQQHQKTAARPTAAEDARTLMALAT
jgi:hypothetical protein